MLDVEIVGKNTRKSVSKIRVSDEVGENVTVEKSKSGKLERPEAIERSKTGRRQNPKTHQKTERTITITLSEEIIVNSH